MQLAQRRLGGAEVSGVAVGLGDVQRDAVDPASDQGAPAAQTAAPARSQASRPRRARAVRARTDERPAARSRPGSGRAGAARPRPRRLSPRKRPRSTVENTSRLSTTSVRQRPSISSGKAMRLSRRASSTIVPRRDCGYSAATAWSAPAIQRSRSLSARALSACFLASVFSGPRSRVPSGCAGRRLRERRKQSEIDVHRLVGARAGIDGLDMAAGDVRRAAHRAPWSAAAAQAVRRAVRRRRSGRPAGRWRRIPHSLRSR